MKKNFKLIIAIVLAVVIFTGVYFLYNALSKDYSPDNLAQTQTSQENQNTNDAQNNSQTDYSAPDFTVFDYDNKEVKLSDYFGKPIVLNMWASWCSPCKMEMPYFEQAYKDNKDIQFLMVNMTAGDNINDAKALIENEGYTFPVLFDKNGEAASVYGASSLPMTIFIDKNGDLVTYAVGALSAENLNTGIDLIR